MSRFQIFSMFMFAILSLSIVSLWYFHTQISLPIQPTPTYPTIPPASTSSQLATLQSSLDTLARRLDKIEGLPTLAPRSLGEVRPTSAPAPFQKQVLTLGSANTTSLAWSQTGLEITINSADYPASVMAYFEAGLNCAGGIAWARVTNKTTGAIIDISEVSHNTNTVTYKRSVGFKLHPGNNNYVVELRSSGGEVVSLSSSRIVIEKP